MHDDFESDYSELLKSNKTTMTTERLRSLCAEVYKTLNQLNPRFISNMFKLSSANWAARKQQVFNLETIRLNQVNFSEKKFGSSGSKKNETTSHYISNLLKIFQSLRVSQNLGTISIGIIIYVKPLRSEDLAS